MAGLEEDIRRIFAEAEDWQRLQAQDADATLKVYLDLKSPHAYLAVRPSLEVARDYRVHVEFLPFTLSYEAFGITTSVEPDMQRRPPSAAADRKARMYYTAAREYAAMQRLPFRTPHRLLDSTQAHRAWVFAKRQGLEVPFIMSVYLHGWGSGWREYELESDAQLTQTLADIGADLGGLGSYLAEGGAADEALAQYTEHAEQTGYVGVPHFVFPDERLGREVGIFGREHLTFIRERFAAQGLARRADVRAEFTHAWRGPADHA